MSEDFRDNTDKYARFRPSYPSKLFSWLAEISPSRLTVWDCATGSGQAAIGLADHFDSVIASDVNESQIEHASEHDKIDFRCFTAETTPLENSSIDLVTVACAVHWFDRAAFYKEIRRVCRPNGVLAVWTYDWPWMNHERLNSILREIKDEALGEYWPEASQLYFGRYETLEFPFKEVSAPRFSIDLSWGPDDVLNFISTWSASQRYLKEKGEDVTNQFRSNFKAQWEELKVPQAVELPLYMRVGRVGV